MHRVIEEFLKEERITAVLSSKNVEYNGLRCIEYRFVKGGEYYRAVSYATSTWIAPSPLGPAFTEDGVLTMDSLQDIAELSHFKTAKEVFSIPEVRHEQLVDIYRSLHRSAHNYALTQLGIYSPYISEVRFLYTPVPMIIASLVYEGKFLGSVSATLNGTMTVLSRTKYFQEYIPETCCLSSSQSLYTSLQKGLEIDYE